MSTLWPDTVKRGPMVREVRRLGTLVPVGAMVKPATTDGRVERKLVYPGTPVKADTVVMTLTSRARAGELTANLNRHWSELPIAEVKNRLGFSLLRPQRFKRITGSGSPGWAG